MHVDAFKEHFYSTYGHFFVMFMLLEVVERHVSSCGSSGIMRFLPLCLAAYAVATQRRLQDDEATTDEVEEEATKMGLEVGNRKPLSFFLKKHMRK